ncbi:Uncharacterised protein [Mycobacteroides abscessus subsp. abscessus]|nr:Uncharacterised protein [Mycobacteroides abscessus subsp. abscessus]
MLRQAFGQRRRHVPDGPGVGDRAVAVGQFQLCGERYRPRPLNLDGTFTATMSAALPFLLKRIHVLVEKAARPANHGAGASGSPVPGG